MTLWNGQALAGQRGQTDNGAVEVAEAAFDAEAAASAADLSEATQAKYGRPQVFLGVVGRFPRAMLEIAKVSEYGAKKHGRSMSDMSFLHVPAAGQVYLEAEARHMVKEATEGEVNEEDGRMFHKAQKAWNALADLEVFLMRDRTDG